MIQLTSFRRGIFFNRKICLFVLMIGILLFVEPVHAMPYWAFDRAALVQKIMDMGYAFPVNVPEIDMMEYVEGFQGGEVVIDIKATDKDHDTLTFTRPRQKDLPEGARFFVTRDEEGLLQGRLVWSSKNAVLNEHVIPVEVSDGRRHVEKNMTVRIVAAEKETEGRVYISNVDYTASGQIAKIEYGNGVTTTYSYDPLMLR